MPGCQNHKKGYQTSCSLCFCFIRELEAKCLGEKRTHSSHQSMSSWSIRQHQNREGKWTVTFKNAHQDRANLAGPCVLQKTSRADPQGHVTRSRWTSRYECYRTFAQGVLNKRQGSTLITITNHHHILPWCFAMITKACWVARLLLF